MKRTTVVSEGCRRLRVWMERSKLTNQAAAARELGIGYDYFTKIHRGLRLPGRNLAVQIAEKTGIPVEAWASSQMDKTTRVAVAVGRNS